MNAKISVFVIYVEAIIYLVLYNLHDCTFKYYFFKSRDIREVSLEGLKKNIIKIYNIEKQICFNDSKKETKF